MASREEAVARSFAVKQTMLIGRRGDCPPDVSQLEWLFDLAAVAPDGVAVEVGVHYGGSLACWAGAREGKGRLVAVDNWSLRGRKVRRGFLHYMAMFDLQVELVEVESWDAPALIEEAIAFCFIDSDHSDLGIGKDVPVWTDAMMPRGIIAFHDYGVSNPMVAVKACVDMWHSRVAWERLGVVGSTIAFRRPM